MSKIGQISRREFGLNFFGVAAGLKSVFARTKETKVGSPDTEKKIDFGETGRKLHPIIKEAIGQFGKRLNSDQVVLVKNMGVCLDSLQVPKEPAIRNFYNTGLAMAIRHTFPIYLNGEKITLINFLKDPKCVDLIAGILEHELHHIEHPDSKESEAYEVQFKRVQRGIILGKIPKEYQSYALDLKRLAEEWKRKESSAAD